MGWTDLTSSRVKISLFNFKTVFISWAARCLLNVIDPSLKNPVECARHGGMNNVIKPFHHAAKINSLSVYPNSLGATLQVFKQQNGRRWMPTFYFFR